MVVLELMVVEVYANGFIRPSKSPAGAPRQAGKGLILPKDFCWLTLAWFFTFSSADIRFASEGLTRSENLYGCRSFADDQVIELFSTKEFATAAQETICGSVSKIKNVSVTISAEYSDYTDILASTIILLTWPSKSPAGTPKLFIRNDNSLRLCV